MRFVSRDNEVMHTFTDVFELKLVHKYLSLEKLMIEFARSMPHKRV